MSCLAFPAVALDIGMNLAGAACWDPWISFNPNYPTNSSNPGFVFIDPNYFTYWRSLGIRTIRLPTKWESFTPVLGGPIEPNYLTNVIGIINDAQANGQSVLIDIHNSGYFVPSEGALPYVLGAGPLAAPFTAYAPLWQDLATDFRSHPNIAGYDIMSEPVGFSSSTWVAAAQTAINSIRTVDMHTPIYVEGLNWSNSVTWAEYNPTLNALLDPAHNLIFEAHNYFNACEGCSYTTWTSQDQVGMLTNQFTCPGCFGPWLAANGVKGSIGESGVGQDPHFLEALQLSLQAYRAAGLVSFYYWEGSACTSPAGPNTSNISPPNINYLISPWPIVTATTPQTNVLFNQ